MDSRASVLKTYLSGWNMSLDSPLRYSYTKNPSIGSNGIEE